jgi:hypothetical protein
VWNIYEYDLVMRPAEAEQAVVTYPPADADDFFVSGFADGEEELGSTAALVDEPVGEGRSIVFATEPNFRGFTDGTQTLLFNALFGDDPAAATTVRSGTAARRAAAKQARRLDRQPEAIRVSVALSDAAAAEAVLSGYGPAVRRRSSPGKVAFTVANPRGLAAGASVRYGHPPRPALQRGERGGLLGPIRPAGPAVRLASLGGWPAAGPTSGCSHCCWRPWRRAPRPTPPGHRRRHGSWWPPTRSSGWPC